MFFDLNNVMIDSEKLFSILLSIVNILYEIPQITFNLFSSNVMFKNKPSISFGLSDEFEFEQRLLVSVSLTRNMIFNLDGVFFPLIK